MKETTIRLDDDLLAQIHQWMDLFGLRNRSEAIRVLLRRALTHAFAARPDKQTSPVDFPGEGQPGDLLTVDSDSNLAWTPITRKET